jgi:hypothetical protein
MKRLLFFTPLVLVLAACGGTTTLKPAAPLLSHSATIDDVPLRLDVTGLARVGRAVALDLRLTNRAPRGGDAFEIGDSFSSDGFSDDLGGVTLIDRQTGREVPPLNDDGVDLYSLDIGGGGSQTLSVAFPAPRAASVDVLVPHFGLFRDVPIH